MSERSDVGTPGLSRDEHAAAERFAQMMESVLAKNAHKGSWKTVDVGDLLRRLNEENTELVLAVERFQLLRQRWSEATPVESFSLEQEMRAAADEVVHECIDVANFSMFIADVAGGLE